MNRTTRFPIQPILLFCFFVVGQASIAYTQEANDEDAFFNGTYQKVYISKHKVKTVTAEQYVNNKKVGSAIYHFDQNGLLQKMICLDSTGKKVNWHQFSFDAHGNQSSIISKHASSERPDTTLSSLVYEGNLLVQEKSTYALFPTCHLYNAEGKRIASENKYVTGWLTPSKRKVQYSYDEKDRLVHVTERIVDSATDSTQQWMSDRTYKYPSKTLALVSERIQNGDIPPNKGNLTIRYDHNGNLISKESDAIVSRYYTYDRKGLMQSKIEKFPSTFEEGLGKMKFETRYHYTFW
ncbi:MAG TPA: hypothetical protein VLC98_08595 [Phnomibacter sp.]|nr:hypothetical protein [Phnomibacter sp.]